MRILTINTGSSSIKYKLFDMLGPELLIAGIVERIGEAMGRIKWRAWNNGSQQSETREEVVPDHAVGLARVGQALTDSGVVEDLRALDGIGHRVVHGGERFREPTLIDDNVVSAIRQQIPLAPLHNPANLAGIEVARRACPEVPQVAVFDTAFHQSLSPAAYLYAVPYTWYERYGIRRYGFHGTSHEYVAGVAAEFLGRPLEELRLITLHLGNGASAAAISHGRCQDTSMGLTPLEGLMMGTRCGDIDAAIVPYLAERAGMSLEAIDAALNRESGLLGICGENDMRSVLKRAEAGDPKAQLAVEMYALRIKKYIGAYLAVLGGADAIVFTAGVGEHAAAIRALACAGLESLGIRLDEHKNQTSSASGAYSIHAEESRVQILVVPTDEELAIAHLAQRCIEANG